MKDEMTEKIIMRGPINRVERLKAALCSTINDLHPDGNGRVIVSGVLPNKERIYLGDIDESILYQSGVSPMQLIEHIRFGK